MRLMKKPSATPEDYRRTREAMGLSNYAFARVLGIHLRTAQRYEAGETPIPPPVALLLRYLERDARRRKQFERSKI